MIRRTFIATIGSILSLFGLNAKKPLFPDPVPIELINGIWEAPGFTATFTCMKCGCCITCNNIITCIKCNSSHFAVTAVHFNRCSFYAKPPAQNCIMARNSAILVPTKTKTGIDAFDRYEAGSDHRPVKKSCCFL